MQIPLKIMIDERFVRRDGTCTVYIQYNFSSQKHPLLNTQIEVPPAFWDIQLRCIKDDLPEKYGEAFELNLELKRIFRIAEDIVIFATRMNLPDMVDFVKRTFHPDFNVSSLKDLKNSIEKKDAFKNLNIYFQIDDYILSKVKKVSQHMPRVYKNMKEHLQEFESFREKPITFEILDLTFYEEFVDFLMYDYVHKRRNDRIVGLKINTIGKTIKQFRTFLRNRMRKRIIPQIDMEGWTILEEEVDAVYLPWKQVKLIYQVDLIKQPHLENYRDDFVLGCMTGLRFSDFSRLMKSDLRGDMLYKKQQKSDHWVVIPLRPEAKEILKRRFKNNTFPLTNAEFNRHIKSIAELAGINEPIKHSYKKGNKEIVEIKAKCKWITSHTCRRSFCTNEFLAGTPVELIMKLSGHKSVKDFYKYIRVTPEEAGNKIKELWLQRDGMNVFDET